MDQMWSSAMPFWMLFGALWTLLFWGGLIALIVWVVLRVTRQREQQPTPLDVLKMRYAKGEITKEEFDRRKADLL